MPPRRVAQRKSKALKETRSAEEHGEHREEPIVEPQRQFVDLTVKNILNQPVDVVVAVLNDRRYYWLVASLLALFQLVLGIAIILKVPCECDAQVRTDLRHQDRLGCVHAASGHVPFR